MNYLQCEALISAISIYKVVPTTHIVTDKPSLKCLSHWQHEKVAIQVLITSLLPTTSSKATTERFQFQVFPKLSTADAVKKEIDGEIEVINNLKNVLSMKKYIIISPHELFHNNVEAYPVAWNVRDKKNGGNQEEGPRNLVLCLGQHSQ
jgi:hypothetical protein